MTAATVDETNNNIVEQAKEFYSSDDSQLFYKNIWGVETIHIGRYDLLTDQERQSLSVVQQILRAQEIQEDNFLDIISNKFDDNHGTKTKLDILDMGCGYGGVVPRLL
mmetsp:Transcript_9721/g.18783  ORF Transcript_9721/g.18783 Transcript_9721/m.18783 type:complete len:108 (+) Transcript_9721:181-504(+)